MEEEQRNGKGLFYGVIGVATLIVAIIGATFAWFTANADSGDAQEIVKTGTLTITYEDGQKILLNNMMPATAAQVATAYTNDDCAGETAAADAKEAFCSGGASTGTENETECQALITGGDTDVVWHTATPATTTQNYCSAYKFIVTNTGSLTADITTDITINSNSFTAGKVMYKVIETGTAFDAAVAGTATAIETPPTIAGYRLTPSGQAGNTKSYTIVFWLDSTAGNENMNKSMTGSIAVTANQTNRVNP